MNLEKRQADVPPPTCEKVWVGSLSPTDCLSENTAFVFHKAELTFEQIANFAPVQILKARVL